MGLRVTVMPEEQSLHTKGHGSTGQVATECQMGVTEHRMCPGVMLQKAEPCRKANHCRRVMPVYLAKICKMLKLGGGGAHL